MKKILLTLLIISIWKCGMGQTSTQNNLSGFWKSMGYGLILDINDNAVKAYDICEISCLPKFEMPLEELKNIYTFESVKKESFLIKAGITEYNFVRIQSIPNFCKESTPSQKENPVFNFQSLWQTFNEQYAYFDERKIDWNHLREKYEPRLSDNSSQLELYLVIDEMLNEIKDGHVSINLPSHLKKEYEKTKINRESTEKKDFNQSSAPGDIFNYYVKKPNSYNKGIISWGYINNDVAYINIGAMDYLANYDPTQQLGMSEFWDNYWEHDDNSENSLKDKLDGTRFIMDKIVSEIKNVKACIIDIRFNGGGEDPVALEILNHFASEKTVAFTKKARFDETYTKKQKIRLNPSEIRFNGDVYILTSPRTASAAEIFVLSSMVLENAKRIGSNTTGILSDKLLKNLPIGWEYTLSNEVYQSVNGVNYENIGIPPDYSLDYGSNSVQFYTLLENKQGNKDDAIEMALEMIKKNK